MIKIFKTEDGNYGGIFERADLKSSVGNAVSEIIENVRKNGDKALFEYTEKFDGVKLTSLKVEKEEIDEAINLSDKGFQEVLKSAAANIRAFHEEQRRQGFSFVNADGITVGQKIIPIERVGVYVPGGTAAYPSTVLMDVIPAKIAGCNKIVMVSPPDKNGKIAPEILVAAFIAGVDEIYKIGGAQAIAALAYGTKSVPAVYKIVGPGNAYVAEAKRQVFGQVSIDMIAGPSEILIVSDDKTSPQCVAADLLSQAEHDKNASAVLVTDSYDFALKVSEAIETRINSLSRRDIARASIDNNGKIIVVENILKAIEIANELAPEHLELCIDDAMEYLPFVKNAGSVFIGRYTPEALGDYYAGPNHTLPTSGTAKFSSPLSVDDFIKKTQFICATEGAVKNVAANVALFARREGLTAHAESAEIRLEKF